MTTYKNSQEHSYLEKTPRDRHHAFLFDSLLSHFGVRPGEGAVEIGAGSGRYTRMLLEKGVRVNAVEPDAYFVECLRDKFADEPLAQVTHANLLDMERLPGEPQWLCGFHVLHHLEKRHFDKLRQLLRSSGSLRGWFFLEPNGWNPLFLLQLALTPAMSFGDERGVWTHDYGELLGREDRHPFRGCLGLFPPRAIIDRLPEAVQRLGTRFHPLRTPFASYCVYGEVLR